MRAHGTGPALARDRAVLIRLARHRVLSLFQLGRLVFPGLHRSQVSRRIATLVRGGWLTTWDQPVALGGRPRFVVPTTPGLLWALERIEAQVAAHPYAQLVGTMLRRDGRRPLPLVRGVVPPWLRHLAEVNDVLLSLQVDPALAVVWASSWNRPLPMASHGVALPQPDGVVVLASESGPSALVFVEHDRGGESLRHFRLSKVDRYRQLAQRPALLAELTGFRAFRVLVTVRTGDPSATAQRLVELGRCASERLAGSIFHFASVEVDSPDAGGLVACGPPRL